MDNTTHTSYCLACNLSLFFSNMVVQINETKGFGSMYKMLDKAKPGSDASQVSYFNLSAVAFSA